MDCVTIVITVDVRTGVMVASIGFDINSSGGVTVKTESISDKVEQLATTINSKNKNNRFVRLIAKIALLDKYTY